MKLIHKLVLGYLVIALFGVLTTYIAIRSFQHVENTFDNLTKDVVPEIELLKDMKSGGLRIVSSTHEIIALRSEAAPDVEEQVEEEQVQIRNAKSHLEQSLGSYEALARQQPNHEYSTSDEAGFAKAMHISGEQLINTSTSLIDAKTGGVRGAEMSPRPRR